MERPFFLAVGAMIGFLSHLVLDELCSVDLNGWCRRLNQFAGSAVKLVLEVHDCKHHLLLAVGI